MTPAGSRADTRRDSGALTELANAFRQLESKARVVPYTAQACIELHTKLASLEAALAALTQRVQEHEVASADRPSSTSSVPWGRLVVPAVILLGLALGSGVMISHQLLVGNRASVAVEQLRISATTNPALSGVQSNDGSPLGLQLLGSSAVSTQHDVALDEDPFSLHARSADAASKRESAAEPASSVAPPDPTVQPTANASVMAQSNPADPPIPAVVPAASPPNPGLERRDARQQRDEAAGPTSGGSKAADENMAPANLAPALGQSDPPQAPPAPAPPVATRTIFPAASATPDTLDPPAADSSSTKVARTDPSGGKIVVQATADAWIQVRDGDGRQILSRLLHKDDSWVAPDMPGLSLTTGNAGGIEILVDGVVMPALGRSGDVRKNISLSADSLRGRPQGL